MLTSLKAARDEQRDLCNALGDKILAGADLAAEYWLTDSDQEKLDLIEVRLLGAQAYLAQYRGLATDWFSKTDKAILDDRFADLYDSMTGGKFQVKGRPVDLERARNCQIVAASTAVLVREANVRSISWWSVLRRASHLETMASSITRNFQWQLPRRY